MPAMTASRPRPRTASPVTLPPVQRELGLFTLLALASVALLLVMHPPWSLWPLAPAALAPWAFAATTTHRAWLVHWGSFLAGWLYFLIGLSWLMPVTGLGFVALAFYLAIYWTLAAWAVRTALRARVPVALSLPVAWIACEYLRAWVMTGFPWLFLAHAFFQWPLLIQIADFSGAYGVSFLVAMISGALVDGARLALTPQDHPIPRARVAAAAGLCAALVAAALGYGAWRLGQQDALRDGPRVAVVQHDFPLKSTPPYGTHDVIVFASYMALAAEAAEHKPDIMLFPETVWGSSQNIGFLETPLATSDDRAADTFTYSKLCHDATAALARGEYAEVNRVLDTLERLTPRKYLRTLPGERLPRLRPQSGPPVTIVLGTIALESDPGAVNRKFNSAVVYDLDGTQRRQRYDKNHLVPFGEYVPFRQARLLGLDMHWLYVWLNSLSPFSQGGKIEYSLSHGEQLSVFNIAVGGQTYRFGTPICYEDVMPYLVRRYVWTGGRRRVDFLLNMSNDGWFQHSAELPQHLAICVFRAVENRVGIARAVNTGVSGFVDPCGRVYNIVRRNHHPWGVGSVGVETAPVRVDSRTPPYAAWSDWLPRLCLLGSAVLWMGGVVTRWVAALRRRIVAWIGRGAAT